MSRKIAAVAWLGIASLMEFAFPASACADLLWQKIPEDGTWVTFQCSEEYADGTKRKLWLTIKSVGQDKVEDQVCRWVELKYQNEEARKAGTGSVMKFLIPEKELATGGDPFGQVQKAWKGSVGEPPIPIEDVGTLRHRLNLVLSPPIKDLKKSQQRKIIDGPKDKLHCNVWQGTGRYEIAGEKVTATYSLGLHDDPPTGIAWAKIELDASPSGMGTIVYSLTDIGASAVSDFPDAK